MRVRNPGWLAIVAGAIALAAIPALAWPASATPRVPQQPATPACAPSAATLARTIAALRSKGASDGRVDAALAATYGLVRATGADYGIRARSVPRDINNGSVTVVTPAIYTDSCGGYHNTYVDAPWRWTNNFSDVADGTHNDGIAIAFNQPVHITGSSDCHWGTASARAARLPPQPSATTAGP